MILGQSTQKFRKLIHSHKKSKAFQTFLYFCREIKVTQNQKPLNFLYFMEQPGTVNKKT